MLPALLPPAWAHRPGLSYAQIDADRLTLTFARPELGARVPVANLDEGRLLVAEATVAKARLSVGDAPCTLGEATVSEVESDGVQIVAPLDCPSEGPWRFDAAYLPEFEAGHRQFLEAGGVPVAVLDASRPTAEFAGVPDRWDVAGRWGGLGIEHIWTGYDHVLFLMGLLLAATSLRAMLLIVTGFTIAHSITLTLAATGIFTLSPSFVEPAIALSIAWVGIENLWKPTAGRRVAITFLLGLVHGFGFAGMLAELGLPANNLALALVSFNGGVEVGQAAIVAVVLPLLLLLRRTSWWERRAVPAASIGVALAGIYWFVERT